MSRWQIQEIVFYSHDGRRRAIDFELGTVNIITGVSNSGKSAIVEVIDYCLGASRCHIPGIVREASSWVGVLWSDGEMRMLVCRKVPASSQVSSDEVFFEVGRGIDAPNSSDDLAANTSRDGSLRQFEQIVHIGDVEAETFASDRKGSRISFRNVVPYLLQSDDVVINKMTLLRGANDERRQSIIDSLPYFLGITDESTVAAEGELRRLRARLVREERRLASAERQIQSGLASERALLQEGAQVGLVPPPSENLPASQIDELLQSMVRYVPGNTAQNTEGANQLNVLQEREREVRTGITNLRNQLAAAEDLLRSADGFGEVAASQERKLEVVTLVSSSNERDSCPVCSSIFGERTQQLRDIESAYSQIRSELQHLRRERPQLDRYIQRLHTNLEVRTEELTSIRRETSAIVAQSQPTSERLELEQRRNRVVGRVSYYLESRESNTTAVERNLVPVLTRQVEELESLVDIEAKEDRLRIAERQISKHATALMQALPFEEHYREGTIDFDLRTLRVNVVSESKSIEMRDIGSDENYLSLHVAILLALHRVFNARDRPVPGVILFDQLSRPFFPPDEVPGEVIIAADDYERNRLKQYFDLLFTEAADQNLQILVLEHAYFADDPRYTRATKMRLTVDDRLIPEDWPRPSEA